MKMKKRKEKEETTSAELIVCIWSLFGLLLHVSFSSLRLRPFRSSAFHSVQAPNMQTIDNWSVSWI
jgi:hypothetical protein